MYKDTYHIEPRYLLERIKKDYEVSYTYMSHRDGSSRYHACTPYTHAFTDENRAEALLEQCRHFPLFSADEEKKEEIEKNKLILIEIVELIKEKEIFIKKIRATYRKKMQRDRQKWDTKTKAVDILATDAYALKRLAEVAKIQQKELLQMLIQNFDQMSDDEQKKLIEKSTDLHN